MSKSKSNQLNVIESAKEVTSDMVKWRRDLHQIPELGLNLPQTIHYVTQVLEKLGIEYDDSYVDGNAIVAVIQGEKEIQETDRVLAMRADMDGLPIEEKTGHAFASKNENMHACGHDGHTAMLLGAAKILQENKDQFGGVVKLFFQPGEEYPGGAKPMIKEGVMENPKVTRVMGFHEGQIDSTIEKGKIAYQAGPMMASMDRFLIEVSGKGYHGAYPESSRDPIVAAAQIVTALQTIKSRNIKATRPHVVSVTRIEGGYNQNIIPDKVELEGTVRTFDNALREEIHHKIEKISQGIGAALDVDVKVTYDYKYPPVINDIDATNEIVGQLSNLFGEDTMVETADPLMGGEDFAFYLQEAPGTFLFLSNPASIDGEFHGHHHPKFDVDEDYFYMGAAGFVEVALNYLSD